MKRAILFAVVAVLAALSAPAQTASPEPTLILLNGKIFTSDESQPFVEALAIAGGRITAAGTTETIRRLARPNTTVIDLDGRTAIPGINDAHLHPGEAPIAFRVDLGPDPTLTQIEGVLASAIDETPASMFIVAQVGPAIINNPDITRTSLDRLAPNRRILLASFTGHGLIMSSAAMAALGVADNAPDPAGGSFGRDANGVVNGRVSEYAQYAVMRRFFDTASDGELDDTLSGFGRELTRLGITSIQAMPMVRADRFLKSWKKAGVPVRLRVIDFPLTLKDPLTPGASGVKWILDGTPIEHGAALRTARYPDKSQGRLNFPDVRAHVEYAARARQQLLVHASGDAAVAQAFDAIAAVRTVLPVNRPRIEHGDGLQRDLIPRALELGAVVVLNPVHFPFRGAYPQGEYMLAKSLVEAKVPLAFGSDGPLNPYLGIMEAVDRSDDAEELTREQAVIAYTAGSAYAEFAEKEKGKLLPGFLADIAVLSQDIFRVRLASLPETQSVLTIINGKVVHSAL